MRKTPDPPHKSLTPDTKTRSDIKIVPSFHDEKRFPQVHLAPWSETRAKVLDVDITNKDVRLVLSSDQRFTIYIPRRQIANESTLPQPDQYISILRTDSGYNILTHPHDPEHPIISDSLKPSTIDDLKPSFRRADRE